MKVTQRKVGWGTRATPLRRLRHLAQVSGHGCALAAPSSPSAPATAPSGPRRQGTSRIRAQAGHRQGTGLQDEGEGRMQMQAERRCSRPDTAAGWTLDTLEAGTGRMRAGHGRRQGAAAGSQPAVPRRLSPQQPRVTGAAPARRTLLPAPHPPPLPAGIRLRDTRRAQC